MDGTLTMADKPTKAALAKIHKQALDRADEAFQFERDNIREGREDQRFAFGGMNQWDAAAQKARGTDRPMLTVNRCDAFVRQVTGDIRQNPPGIKVLPSGGKASQKKAEVLAGIIRSIEAKSLADAVYEKGAENAAQAGQGWLRIVTEYRDGQSFDQDIVIKQGTDPFAVLLDPFARRPDRSDMEYGFVFERFSKESYKAKWPDAVEYDFPTREGEKGSRFEWSVGESIRVAEYWCRETTTRKLYLVDGVAMDKVPKGKTAERERDVEVTSIVSYMMSGKEILSGPHPWAGTVGIPICFIPGREVTIDGATQRKGIIRDAKDPQKLLNYARTTDAEQTALQPKAPFILAIDQIKGFEPMWKSAGTKNHPYLPYNFNPAMGPNQAPQRSQPPAMSTGLQNLSMQAGEDLHHVTGIYPASMGAKSNETSGVAIRARQHEGDTSSNYIINNTRIAVAYAGRIICDLIPKVMDGERIIRILKEDGTHSMARINAMGPAEDDPEGMEVIETLADGEYDAVVSTGPNYLTRQQEMADTILELSRTMPIIGQAAPDLLVKALGFPGGDEIADRVTPPQFKKDDQGRPLEPPPPSPQDIEDMAQAEKAKAEAEGQQIKNLADLTALMQIVQGIPQQIEALKATVAQMAAPPQQGAMPPEGGPPPMDASPIDPAAAPPLMNGEDQGGELVDMPAGLTP